MEYNPWNCWKLLGGKIEWGLKSIESGNMLVTGAFSKKHASGMVVGLSQAGEGQMREGRKSLKIWL